jgi:hypothetical protein
MVTYRNLVVDAYLRVETTGLSFPDAEIMVVGLYLARGSRGRMVQLVGKDITKDSLIKTLSGVQNIFTYNGNRFDLPFIQGIYLIASVRKVKDLCPGSICLFMKDKRTVGEGIVKEFKPYSGREKSPVTGEPYEAVITFAPSSLRRYVKPLELITIRDITGRMLNFRSGGNLTVLNYFLMISCYYLIQECQECIYEVDFGLLREEWKRLK